MNANSTRVASRSKGILSMLLALVITLVALPAKNAWATGYTASQGVEWARSQVGRSIDQDGACGVQCVDLVRAYYAYLGVSPVSGNGCDYAHNNLPSGWSRVQGGRPQAGDILVYAGNSSNPYGHVAIYESDRVTYHQNFSNHKYVERITYSYNGMSNPYWGYIRPNWSSGTTVYRLSMGSLAANNISYSNARLSATVSKTPGLNISACGIYLGTSKSNMTKRNTEIIGSATNNYRGGSGFDIWYDLNSELGIYLNKGTTYYYKFYVTINGREYQSGVGSFKTQGTQVTAKRSQNVKVQLSKKTIKRSAVKKKAQTCTVTVKNAKGKVTIKAYSKYIKVSGKKITVKKGAPKGFYRIMISAAGNSQYSSYRVLTGIIVK